MIENTIEQKALFIAKYLTHRLDDNFYHAIIRGVIQNGKTQKDWFVKTQHLTIPVSDIVLPLTPLSMITDEHAVEVAIADNSIISVCKWDRFEVTRNFKEPVIVWAFNGKKHVKYYITENLLTYKGVDVARSKGYYVGDGVEVKYGWAKLREEV